MGHVSILIIDENRDVRDLLARGLGAKPGFRVIGAVGNPLLGAELAHRFRPHVIIADFRRTGVSRVETFRWIAGMSPNSRLVVLTSYFEKGEEQACLEAGASRCLLKGVTVKDLAQELTQLTAGRTQELSSAKARID